MTSPTCSLKSEDSHSQGTGSKPHLLRWPWSKAPQTLSCEDPVVQEKFRCQVSCTWGMAVGGSLRAPESGSPGAPPEGLMCFGTSGGEEFYGWQLDLCSQGLEEGSTHFLKHFGAESSAEPLLQAPNIDKTDWPVQWLPWLETCHWDEKRTTIEPQMERFEFETKNSPSWPLKVQHLKHFILFTHLEKYRP